VKIATPSTVFQIMSPSTLRRWLSAIVFCFSAATISAADKEIVLIAGTPSHGPREHEFRAGCILLGDCLNKIPGIHATVVSNGWPEDPSLLRSADALFEYCDGGDAHPAIKPDRMKLLDSLAAKGVGIGMAHYAVEVPHGPAGLAMLRWTGGYFETYWSVNPTWTARFESLPDHPVTRGVKPFAIHDEWYHHMLFVPDMNGVTPILSAAPPKNTVGGDDAHGGNPWARAAVAKGESQHLMWVCERPGGGRGFGFTGGHYHKNWGDDNFRKLVLNAILWMAHADVPAGGVPSTVSPEALNANMDLKK
jgi:type 1 glutamine amidotransferase